MKRMSSVAVYLFVFVGLVIFYAIPAGAVPPTPAFFSGTAQVGGVSLPEGTVIKAYGNDGVLYGFDSDGNLIVVMSMEREAQDHTEILGGGNIVAPH